MKKIFYLFSLSAFAACNSGSDTKTESTSSKDSSATDAVSYAYSADYSSKFEIGDPKNVHTVFALYKDWEDNKLDNSKDKFADSVTMVSSSGEIMTGKWDSINAAMKPYRNSLGTVTTQVHAVVPLRSTDKNEDWVLVWFKEYRTDAKGKKDSTEFQETWKLNKDGKADLLYQYQQNNPPAKKK